MKSIAQEFLGMDRMDRLAEGRTAIHRLDPRAKLITTLGFVVVTMSFDRYTLAALLPFTLFPLYLTIRAELPARFLFGRLALAAPFAVLVGIFNPFFDREPLVTLGPLVISAGWISFLSILLRVGLTVWAALALLATTGIQGVCLALEKLGAPRVFSAQLLFLYRYLFVLMDEGIRIHRARAGRSFGSRGLGPRVYGMLLGQWLLRSFDRAERIHLAMLARGFDGHVRRIEPLVFRRTDALFTAGWIAVFLVLRACNLPAILGTLLTGGAA